MCRETRQSNTCKKPKPSAANNFSIKMAPCHLFHNYGFKANVFSYQDGIFEFSHNSLFVLVKVVKNITGQNLN